MLGAASVGKTSLLNRFMHDTFDAVPSTIGASFVVRHWGDRVIAIWDTAGQEKYASLSSFYCRNAGAAILAFDLSSPITLDDVDRHLALLRDGAAPTCTITLVGTKQDLVDGNEAELRERAKQLAEKIGADYIETSAASGINVNEAFEDIFRRALPDDSKKASEGRKGATEGVDIASKSETKDNCCM